MTVEPQDIDYESLAQDAMRGVVRSVLGRVAKSGLPGEHHFYVAFNTQAPGVGISKRLKEKYPEEMTIVLQHRFWDLIVADERFEVKLTFDSIPERLVVPFRAVKVFFDPSVPYGLQFEESELASEASRRLGGDGDVLTEMPSGLARNDGREPTRAPAGERLDKRRERPQRRPKADKPDAAAKSPPAQRTAGGGKPQPALTPDEPPETEARPQDAGDSKVVSLDQFRKK